MASASALSVSCNNGALEIRPIFCRMWVKVLKNKVDCYPQFEPTTGIEHRWDEMEGCLSKLIFVPITDELAAKINEHGNVAIPGKKSQLIGYDLPEDSQIFYYRQAILKHQPVYGCGFCGLVLEMPPNVDKICPRCLSQNEYYCPTCDKLIPAPIIEKEVDRHGNELLIFLCPICEINHVRIGVSYIEVIHEAIEPRYIGTVHHVHIDQIGPMHQSTIVSTFRDKFD